MLKVTAKDFGPIIDGTVELKPLTVFMGPSNTGKSYMATLIYLLTICSPVYGRYFQLFNTDTRSPYRVEPLLDVSRNVLEETQRVVRSWAMGLNTSAGEYPQLTFGELPQAIQGQTNSDLSLLLQSFVDALDEGLSSFFGERKGLTRRDTGQIEILLDQTIPPFSASLLADSRSEQGIQSKCSFDIGESNIVFHPGNLNRIKYHTLNSNDSAARDEEYFLQFFSDLLREAVHQLFASFSLEAFYLPASRSGLMHVYKEVAIARMGRFRPGITVENPTGVISDFIRRMLIMDRKFLKPQESPLSRAIDLLEDSVIQGRVEFEETSDIPFPEFIYDSKSGRFPLSRTSSMVSELAPVILFLKYLVGPGDLLVLEEPESHLHPASQRQMARAIVRLVNAGVKVIITTHSDYFVSQLNNLMRISYASDRWLKGKGFERADCLKHAEVSAYAFRWDEKEGGSRVFELEIRKDVGIDQDEFALVANDLYEETVSFQRIRVK